MPDTLHFLLCVPFPSIPGDHRVFVDEMGPTAAEGGLETYRYMYRRIHRVTVRWANGEITRNPVTHVLWLALLRTGDKNPREVAVQENEAVNVFT